MMLTADVMDIRPRLSDLLKGLADIDESLDCSISGVSMDSRCVVLGDLFLACNGLTHDSQQFLAQAISNGAEAIVQEIDADLDNEAFAVELHGSVPIFKLANLSQYSGLIADRFYAQPSRLLKVIGVTGTNGKTSISHFLANALSNGKPCGVIGTLGNGLYGELETASHTTPDAVIVHKLLNQFLSVGAKYVAMEVSSHGLQQSRVNSVEFDLAVFSNLTRDHLDYHDTMENYAAAKAQLFQLPRLKKAVINVDDCFGVELCKSLPSGVQLLTYGYLAVECHGVDKKITPQVSAKELIQDLHGISFTLITPKGEAEIKTGLLGAFNLSNVLAVAASLLMCKFSLPEIRQRLSGLQTVAGRMERIGDRADQPLVVVDYAHTPDALDKVLQALQQHVLGGQNNARLWCVFGCGGDRDKGKRAKMARVAEQFADQIVVTEDNPRTEDEDAIFDDICSGFNTMDNIVVIKKRDMAIQYALRHCGKNDVVLIAGKGHELYQIIGTEKQPYVGDFAFAKDILDGKSVVANGDGSSGM